MKKIKVIVISIVALFAFTAPLYVTAPTLALFNGAKDVACSGANLNDAGCSDNQGEEAVNSTIATIINLLSFLVGVISVVMIIIGGIRFATSSGNAQSTSAARNTVIFAVVGLVLAVFAQLIVKFVLGKAT